MTRGPRRTWRFRRPDPVPTVQLIGYVDYPEPDSEVERRDGVPIRGWHFGTDAAPVTVAVSAQGRVVAAGRVGTPDRPDVAEVLGRPELIASGWSLTADLSGLTGDHAELVVTLWPELDAAPVGLPPIPVRLTDEGRGRRADALVGEIVRPDEGAVLDRGLVPLVGWALTPEAPVHAVDVHVNGASVGRARLGLPRPHVAEQYACAHAAISGFEALLDLTALPADAESVAVEVIATAPDGRIECVAAAQFDVVAAAPELVRPPEPRPGDRRLWRREAARQHPTQGLSLAVFTHHLGFGGGQLWLSELLTVSGAGRDFPCTVIAPADGPLRHDLERAGIDVHVTQAVSVVDVDGYEGRLAETALLLTALGANAVLVNTMGEFAGADAASRLGLPVVWAIHESFPPDQYWHAAFGPGVVHPSVQAAGARALRAASALVFEAEQTRQQYLTTARPERAVVVPYGIDTAAITAYAAQLSRADARAGLSVPESARLLVVVGTTEPRKAQTMLAEAFAELGPDRADLLLAFVGDTGSPYAGALRAYLDDAQLTERTRLIEVTRDVYPWYRAADVLVNASDVESLPRSALEAMCFSVPVLATAIFGLPELITDGENGFLFEPRHLGATRDALRRVADLDAAELSRIGCAARQHVLDHYDSAGYATDVLALLNGLRRDPTCPPAELIRPR